MLCYWSLRITDGRPYFVRHDQDQGIMFTASIQGTHIKMTYFVWYKQWCRTKVCEVKLMPRQGSMWESFVRKLPEDFPKANLRPIGRRFAWGSLRELFHKASHGSLPWHVFYLTYLRTASLFYILHSNLLGSALGRGVVISAGGGLVIFAKNWFSSPIKRVWYKQAYTTPCWRQCTLGQVTHTAHITLWQHCE